MTSAVLALLRGLCPLFNLSPFMAGAIAAAVAATGLAGGAAVLHHKAYQEGHEAALSEIAEENAETIARAIAKRNVWKDCRTRNGQWDQTTGRCE